MGTVILCVLIADFLTGFFHWIEDTYGIPSWILIGKPVILPNIDHHRNPTAFTMGTWMNRNLHPIIGMVIVSTLFYFLGLSSWPIVLVIILTGFGNEVHSWSHRKQNGKFVTFLQDSGLVISKFQHAKHHRPPYNKYFCVLTNFVNPFLELIRFWSTSEYLLSCLGIHPKRLSPERDGF